MSIFKLVFRSLSFYRTINLMVLLGVALTSAVLSGALVVGDSVRESLRRNAEARLSGIETALIGGERFFTASLADKLGSELAPVLQVEGTVTIRGGAKRSNRVQIIGVDSRFWKLGENGKVPESVEAGGDWLVVNDILANRLDLGVGQPLICRVEIPGELSRDAPLSGEAEQTQPFVGDISLVVGAEQMGRYSLRAEQVPSGTVYLPLERLQTVLEKPGKANLLLAPKGAGLDLEKEVLANWGLEDAAMEIREVAGASAGAGKFFQVFSPRIFLEPETVDLVREEARGSDAILTYLANKIRKGDRLTPYSMVTGTSGNLPSPVPDDLEDNEIVLSQWLADDLSAKPGDTVSLDYYVVESGRRLVEESFDFVVHSIGKIGEQGWDQSWTPEFPGIFEVDDLDEWEPGIPIDRSLIRDKDEDYWDAHRATPKAFISLAAARELFGNRFGNSTSVRFTAESLPEYEENLLQSLDLGDAGLSVRNLRKEAEQAVGQSLDFGSLFASMSFFLIAAALVLTALIFIFGIESRSSQIGLLLATGFTAKKARQLFLIEAAILSVAGALVGLVGGWGYTRLALAGMSGAWRDAASGIEFVYHVKPVTLVISFAATVLLGLITVWLASRAVTRISPGRLIVGMAGEPFARSKPLLGTISFWGLVILFLGGLGLLLAPKVEGSMGEQGMFFGAGFCLTLAGVCATALWLRSIENPGGTINSLDALGRQNTVRRKGRSLAVVGLMAAGVFMVTAINSFRLVGERGAERRDSGTGGFSHVGESTLPIYEDLNDSAGREKYGLDQFPADAFRIIPFRVSDGDDASCLNLNRAQRPRLMGVNPALLTDGPTPFSFTSQIAPEEYGDWRVLEWPNEDAIPAVVDMNTATYALQLKAGDDVGYENEDNQAFDVRLSAFIGTSILQGNLIISEEHFIRQYPGSGGYRYFLLDCEDRELAAKIAAHMTRMFGDRGLEMRPAADRLDEFNAVQNTYLSIFSTLGGLGILLGTLGLAIVVGRNVMERRGQLGLMQAVGFTRRQVARMVLSEHWFLHVSGVLIGIVAALVAVAPKIFDRASDLPWGLLVGVNLAILAGGILFCWIAARLALKGKLLDALRSE